MISAVLGILATRLGRYAAMSAAALLLLFGAYVKGRSDYKEVCTAKAATELARQVNVHVEEMKRATDRLEEIAAENETLRLKLMEVENAADKDPDAVINGIGPDSVRRIDEVR